MQKRTISFALAVLMLLSTLSLFSFAEDHEHKFITKYPAGSSCTDEDRLFFDICTICGEITNRERRAASSHVAESEYTTVIPATIESEGYAVLHCENCDDILGETSLDMLTPTDNFDDVPEESWYRHAVSYVYALSFFSGVGENKFAPTLEMSRAMFVTVAGNICAKERDQYSAADFIDVPAGAWYSASVAWAADKNIVAGTGDGYFSPNLSITREQAALILYKLSLYLGIEAPINADCLDVFSDKGAVSGWAADGVKWAVTNGIVSGRGEGILDPKAVSDRSQNAQMITNFFKNLYLPSIDTTAETDYIASTRELMVDDTVIDKDATTAAFSLNSPEKAERAFSFSKNWESGDTVYHCLVRLEDGSYRMYYKATSDRRRICYIESTDGINWSRPQLTTFTSGGENTNSVTDNMVNPDNLYVFYDTNPSCPDNERWKGIYGQWGDGLFLEKSVDGNYFPFWTPNGTEIKIMGTPSETGGCYFDTLNTVYYDETKGKYVAFVRGFHSGSNYNISSDNLGAAIRDIRYAESDDCINWTTPVPIQYNDGKDYQMYANCFMPYGRDTGIYIGIPTRYNITANGRYTDNLFAFSKDLVNWTRFDAPYMLPGATALTYGDCYPMVGYIETETDYGTELSFYMKEKIASYSGYTILYRYALRADGFGSYVARGEDVSTLVTKPLSYEGTNLSINAKTDEGGYIKVTMKNADGRTVECTFSGNNTDALLEFGQAVEWMQNDSVTLTFELYKAELYSFRFC